MVSIVVLGCILSWCTPIEANWTPFLQGSKCLPLKPLTYIVYAASGIYILSDWILGAMPVFLLWNIQLSWKSKVTVMTLLGLGIL